MITLLLPANRDHPVSDSLILDSLLEVLWIILMVQIQKVTLNEDLFSGENFSSCHLVSKLGYRWSLIFPLSCLTYLLNEVLLLHFLS